jgi:hypothetical protein
MDGTSIWSVVLVIVVAATAMALLYGLWLARDTARLSLKTAQLHAQAVPSLQAAVEAAARVQRLATRPVLKIGLTIQGLSSDVGRTPVVFALRLQNVGHGTAVLEQIELRVRGAPVLSYGGGVAESNAELAARIESQVFAPAVGASLQALSGKLTVTALADEARALEASAALDLLRVQVYAHNADAVEQGLETLSAVVRYRDLDGGHYTSAEQFRSL